MDLYDVMRTTPATRRFTDRPVEREVLHRILDHARFAPSGGNRQGWRVVVVEERETRRRLRDLFVTGAREYAAHVEAGLVPFAPTADGVWHGPAVDLAEARSREGPTPYDDLDEAPVVLVLLADLTQLACMDNGLGRQSIVGGASVYPFAHNLLLAARNEGLGGVLMTMICREEPAVLDLLGAPRPYAVAGLVVLGEPQRRVTELSRRPVGTFATVDRFDGEPFAAG